jgi:hypothetical protein
MGWRWRNSRTSGPLRTTISRSGIGWSLRVLPFLRIGQTPIGRTYVSVFLPGTGLSFIKYLSTTAAQPFRHSEPKDELKPNQDERLETRGQPLTKNEKILDRIRRKD